MTVGEQPLVLRAEPGLKGAHATLVKREGSASADTTRPSEFEESIQECGAERSRQMVLALAPIETESTERASSLGQSDNINSEAREKLRARHRDVGSVTSLEETALSEMIE